MESLNTSTHSLDDRRVVLNTEKKWEIEKSGTYAACEQMIEMSFMLMQLTRQSWDKDS
jgi:hypothetical protein